jgi:hypothetical protein
MKISIAFDSSYQPAGDILIASQSYNAQYE